MQMIIPAAFELVFSLSLSPEMHTTTETTEQDEIAFDSLVRALK